MARDKLFKEKDIAHLRPYRLQYSMKEAGYMLDIPPEAVKQKAEVYDIRLYRLGPNENSKPWYIDHDDLVDLHNKMKMFEQFMEKMND